MRISDWSSDVCSSDLEEVPRHEQARARRGQARRTVRDVLVYRPGPRGPVPLHAAPRWLLRRAHAAGAEGFGRRRGRSVPGQRAGVALPQGGVLPGAGLTLHCTRPAVSAWDIGSTLGLVEAYW